MPRYYQILPKKQTGTGTSIDQPNILGIIRRDEQGHLTPISEPVALHEQPVITFIPNRQGVYVVLGLLQGNEHEQSSLSKFMETTVGRSREFQSGTGATPFAEQLNELRHNR